MKSRWKNPPKVPENTWLFLVIGHGALGSCLKIIKDVGIHGEENVLQVVNPISAFLIWKAGDKRTSDVGSPGPHPIPLRWHFGGDGALENCRRLKWRPKGHEASLVEGSQPRGSTPTSPCLKRSRCQVFQPQ